jgi:hypothetical protein
MLTFRINPFKLCLYQMAPGSLREIFLERRQAPGAKLASGKEVCQEVM